MTKNKLSKKLALALLLPASIGVSHAAGIFVPTDTVVGGQTDGTNFTIGVEGFAGNTNNWPGAEAPGNAIDGGANKYLNFGRANTGIVVTPASTMVPASITIWTANDEQPRDPTSFEIWGTNVALTGGSYAMSDFTLVASDAIALPAGRNNAGILDDANSATVAFTNSTAYASYMIVFPTLLGPGENSMQIAEVQLNTAVIPEPSAAAMFGLGGMLLLLRRRK